MLHIDKVKIATPSFKTKANRTERPGNGACTLMVRNFLMFRSEWKKRSTSEGTPQFPNGISGKLPYHLISNRNFRIFWLNGKHPLSLLLARILHVVAGQSELCKKYFQIEMESCDKLRLERRLQFYGVITSYAFRKALQRGEP